MKEEFTRIHGKRFTFGQRAADKMTSVVGSWAFIIFVVLYIIFWLVLNVFAVVNRWDPYPFILLNLTLSCLAALQAPIILISHKRQAQRDEQRMEYDYLVDRKSEREIETIQKDITEIKEMLKKKK